MREESTKQSWSKVDDLNGEIPSTLLRALQSKVDSSKAERLKSTKQDAICKQIYDKEAQWRVKQIKEVMDIIGDIPKYSIGSEIRSNDLDAGISIEKLIEDVMKLPNIGMVGSDHETEGRDFKVLKEYTNLRNEMITKCQAIRFGTSKLQEIEYQVRTIKVLVDSISGDSVNDGGVLEYLATYHDKVISGLLELKYLLEESIKRSDSHPDERLKLKQVLEYL